jgi:molybdopterin-guanine dinucleotide biosynthesis protein A
VNAILTAGGMTRPGEPLYALTGLGYKALLDLNGQPMAQYTLDALNAAPCIERIVMVGLPPDHPLHSQRPLVSLPDAGDMVANILSGAHEIARLDPTATHALIVSADIPALSGEMVEWMIDQVEALDAEIYYNVIERRVMEARFPGSKRTYVRLKGLEVCGGDLNAIRLSLTQEDNPLWARLIAARKNPIQQASIVGFDTLLLLLLRQLTLQDALRAVCRRLGLRGQALVCPYAELGMDVDKPFQLEIMRQALAGRQLG